MTTDDHITTPHQAPAQIGNGSIHAQVRSLRWTIPLLAAIGLVAILRIPSILSEAGRTSPAVGKPAPQLDLVALDDRPRLEHLQTFPTGSITLLHFWGTWCGPCQMEFPELAAMTRRFRNASPFVFLPVSCEAHGGETFEGLRDKTDRYFDVEGFAFPCYADPRGLTRRSVAQRLQCDSMVYPTSVLIGADGRITGVWEGYTPASVDQMESLINRLLKQLTVATESS